MKLHPKISEDPETIVTRAFGTFLVLLSGILIYTDKFVEYFDIQVAYQFEYYTSLDVFLWTICQTLTILILATAFFFNPYKWSLSVPIIIFSLQLSYVFRDEKWIQEQYYLLYSLIFVATIFGFIYFSKYVNSIMAKFLNIKQKEVDTLVNFVVEVRNEHYAKILASADLLDVLDEFEYDETEKQLLKHFLKKDRNKLTRNFEIRIVQTLKDVD
ncbi:hypothetical protein M3P19_13835 [Muricauda sp. 2012CJ35-5]|uniref:Uncharacterized protein n=1 Tax=Flagellimonas spongiicola TaxID=2942208 RepID=A0ABT0PUR6_9FLAO|nr:hypothetical protein [Allomuricauda spongiicola]MCL6275095.1 hypothetical protein [Allomuricauda spongiicola]